MKEVADLKQNKTKQKAECSTSGAFIFFWRVHKQPYFDTWATQLHMGMPLLYLIKYLQV